MIRNDYHVHTTFCDGKDSPSAIARYACDMGLHTLGFSAHSDTFFDKRYCLKQSDYDAYRACIHALQAEYKGKMNILCGIEQDCYSTAPTDGFDYVIGSVHYLKCADAYIPIDESAQILRAAADDYFGGDLIALAQEYFRTVSQVVARTNCTIIGHFDLISKFNEGDALFDSHDMRYIQAYRDAIDALIVYKVPFEINTGAISRGYRSSPYPSSEMLAYLFEKGAKVILCSDAHQKEHLCFQFEKWEQHAKEIGFSL